MLNNYCYEERANKMNEYQIDFKYYENKSGSKYNRRCIDGKMTGCGNCVGYCQYIGHSGFLTKEQRKEHNCIEKCCIYYLPKIKQEKTRKLTDNRQNEVFDIANNLISKYEGMRIINVSRNQSGRWLVNYISITNGYSIVAIENKISMIIGESIKMVNLNYDFDYAAHLIFAI